VEIAGELYHVGTGLLRALPQGAPTSPGLANAIAAKMDRRLAKLAASRGFAYTRYADDLTFSGDDTHPAHLDTLVRMTVRIVNDEGFAINGSKTRIMRAGAHQQVTGVTVNRELGLSRQKRRQLRAAWHQASRAGARGPDSRLKGWLAYLRMLNPRQLASVWGRFRE
jgi:RNA-directed DNA polymerase